ncbi:30S ribosomal protein S16 [Georgenia subflava]|uniref:Small ribosomal subunit protein bS16 n=1 Tax=Georgenia subflava TaxID=1622177 RepID=A0A6N7EPY7_9MICO|nr:30S ribosomal protein S16 [Georgenia subflava]MPV38216.1 30S ribosomal protein S16 [Georgenia subflava]
MAVKIRLKRMGKIHAPYYRVVVMDSRKKRDGRAIEEIGKYHPTEEPSLIDIDSERAQYWLSVGAQPTEQVAALLKVTGDWQQHKGLPGAEGTLRTKDSSEETSAETKAAAVKAAEEEAEKRKARAAEAKAAKEEAPAATEPEESAEGAAEQSAAPAEEA